MKIKKICTAVLAAAVAASVSACHDGGSSEKPDNSKDNSSTVSGDTTNNSTSTSTTDSNNSGESTNSAQSVKVYYGWGGAEDEAEYTTEIFCPEGAEFEENTLKNNKDNGSVMTADVYDEENEYYATSVTHWHRDAYNNEPTAYPIVAQLYFDGELDAETAAENSNCSQKVTPLGFKWNGYDVILIETSYTFKDYGETTEIFAGVEYDLKYWKTEEGTGKINNLTTKALFGFDLRSTGWDDLTQNQCAWIIGELFGVDSGVANPYAKNDETSGGPAASIDNAAIVGKWVDKASDWEDTYVFNADGTGCYTSGFDYEFTYKISGDKLTVTFDRDDIEEYTISVDGSKITLVDKFSYAQSFEKTAEESSPTESETSSEPETSTEPSNPNLTAVIGTWTESTTGLNETFAFNADGTGRYSCLSEGGTYSCGFTYEFLRSDYIEIFFDDGDEGGFQIVIDGNTMTVRNEYVWDLAYTRQ